MFTAADHARLATLFTSYYSGYKPDVKESPNGDGKIDVGKRYLHINLKYNPPEWALYYLARAHMEACRVAEALDCPLYPKIENATLRVLEYPAGAGSEEHTDYDLFSLHCYRSHASDFVRLDPVDPRAEVINPHFHVGEIGEIVGLGKATRHMVPARPYPQQAIVYFAWPAFSDKLGAVTAREWLAERSARSRYK